jgi:hypothetical protein
MPTFLSDPTPTLYLVLTVAAVVTAGVWYRAHGRKSLAAMLVAVGALAAVVLIDRLVDSPREEAVTRVRAMAEAATAANGDRFVESLSPSFRYKQADREAVRRSGAWAAVRNYQARIAVWGFSHAETEYRGENEVMIRFYAKAESPQANAPLIKNVEATFVRDPDGPFRLKTMKFFTPGAQGRTEDDIPHFP